MREILASETPQLGKNPLIFPDATFVEDCVPFFEPPGSQGDVDEVSEAWAEVISG